jgi:hypothetical protein
MPEMITIAMLRKAGASDALIVRVLELEQQELLKEQEEELEAHRERKRINKKNQRLGHRMSPDVTSVTGDTGDIVSSSSPPSSSPPTPPLITTPSSSSSRSDTRARASRLQFDWKPSEVDFEYAHSKGLPHARIATEGEKFRNYWTAKAGRDATKIDWSRTWQNWILNAISNGGNGHGRGQKPTLAEQALELAAEARQREIEAGLIRPDEPVGGADDGQQIDLDLSEWRRSGG